jgi:hypothetical protein
LHPPKFQVEEGKKVWRVLFHPSVGKLLAHLQDHHESGKDEATLKLFSCKFTIGLGSLASLAAGAVILCAVDFYIAVGAFRCFSSSVVAGDPIFSRIILGEIGTAAIVSISTLASGWLVFSHGRVGSVNVSTFSSRSYYLE